TAEAFKLIDLQAPDATLRAKPEDERAPGDDKKLRELRVRFVAPEVLHGSTPANEVASAPRTSEDKAHESGLLSLFRAAGESYWLLPFVAFWFGAVHALTPGHGKTLVAAYLVGQKGTAWHALVLGLVTTFTHTSVVFALAILLMITPLEVRTSIQSGLELLMGLLILCLGFYLL